MFQSYSDIAWEVVFRAIMYVKLCVPWIFSGNEDNDPDPANDVEGGPVNNLAAFSYISIVVPSVCGLIYHAAASEARRNV